MLAVAKLRPAALLGLPWFVSGPMALQQVLLNHRRCFCTSRQALSSHRRAQDFNTGFSSSYDPSDDSGRGPMFTKAKFGVPQFYPRDLKKRVDEYVIGQDRAKKTICATIFNHYQRLRRKHHQEDSDRLLREKLQRQRFARDRELHGRYQDKNLDDESFSEEASYSEHYPDPSENFYAPEDKTLPQHVKIDKSNLLLVGPTGVGKTYILETLSKLLNVPFTISDCNSFTQAGYIGQDVEACIERLLIDANYDISAAEYGIVILDEFDKIARRETAHGRDVGGEGVQQALLKLVEGTRVTVNVKDNRSSSRSASPITSTYGSPSSSSSSPSSSLTSPPQATPPSGKVDQYTIDTSNILFVFTGAFVGLDKHIIRRIAKPSIGFGSEIRNTNGSSMSGSKAVLPPEAYAHLPYQPTFAINDKSADSPDKTINKTVGFTPLDLANPLDLQAFGFIPELIGRVHNICALSPLSLDELHRILTEPRNSLVQQYTSLFETYPSRLRFTRKALYAIAERAQKNETGARGLKMEMERVLAEPMFDAPMAYVLITEACVRGKEKAGYWGKDGRFEIERRIQEEDEDPTSTTGIREVVGASFEHLRKAGQSGA